MKILKILLVLLIVLFLGAIGLYYFGTNLASEKIADEAAEKLDSSGQLENIKSYVENDPELSKYIEEAKGADESSLPFTSTGQATRVLIQKVGLTELNNIKTGVENGTMSHQEAIRKLEGKLSAEEMLALKVIAYKQLYGKQ